ncbi:helix-turn-helix domain-containing protein [uncultured Roseobacter sp.]|uniref:helix-turn-helix domain-containing protein n=1 Tax=uncultured Roseobacter sp. TaxID=114847 RepID=UPI0026200155|nr:helix-turn-helix domain-containing protein [uncultured Roseobacter sp.]
MTAPKESLLNKWRAAQLALVRHDLPSRAHLLFFRLLYHHNNQTGQCYPGEELLAAALNCTTRTVRNALRDLELAGLVKTRKGPESPPRNYYVLTLFTGSTDEYRLAEKKCLQRRKEASGKSENEPKKYRQRKQRLQNRAQNARGTAKSEGESLANKKGKLERILIQKLGGGAAGWAQVIQLDEATIEEAVKLASASNETLGVIADQLFLDLERSRSGEG